MFVISSSMPESRTVEKSWRGTVRWGGRIAGYAGIQDRRFFGGTPITVSTDLNMEATALSAWIYPQLCLAELIVSITSGRQLN